MLQLVSRNHCITCTHTQRRNRSIYFSHHVWHRYVPWTCTSKKTTKSSYFLNIHPPQPILSGHTHIYRIFSKDQLRHLPTIQFKQYYVNINLTLYSSLINLSIFLYSNSHIRHVTICHLFGHICITICHHFKSENSKKKNKIGTRKHTKLFPFCQRLSNMCEFQ